MAKIKEALETMDEKIKARSKKGTIPSPFLEKVFRKEGLVSDAAKKEKQGKK